MDLQVAYQLGRDSGWLDGLRLALSAENVFDEDPPFISSPVTQIVVGFDPTNASPIGRFLSLTATLLRVCGTGQREREDDDAQARSSAGDCRRHAA